jgi:hypothetical protein
VRISRECPERAVEVKVIITILIICCLGLGSQRVYAYEPINHEQLSESAAKQSKLATDPSVLVDLGLKPYADVGQKFANSTGSLLSIEELIKFGARNEDSVARPANHFYNPLTGQGVSGFTSSPNWAIDGEGDTSTTKFSFRAAREYMFSGLTDSSESFRLKQFGLMFQSLGQVIHHIQDMAAPQHVRDDKHCDAFFPCQIPGSLFGLHNPSHFEKWTLENVTVGPLLGTLPVYAPVYGVGDVQTFNSPRKFWHTEPGGPNSPLSGKGIAEFTNRNFVSAGTNFDKPQQPSPPLFALPAFDPTRKSEPMVAELCSSPNLNPPCPPSMTAFPQARLTFYETAGHDNFLNVPFTNPRASSESIFDEQLRAQGERPVFALNRFNFDEAYKHLIPRAVAYSAGMINYFFRGKIDIDADPNNPGGYLIKNLGAEALSGKFALYYDATDGSRKGVRDSDGNLVVWDSRIILASVAGQISPGGGAMPVTGFATPDDAKTPGEYLLVFSGDMGEEKADEANGVMGAVAAKFVSAPGANGTLYILTRNVFNRLQTLKVDKTGTASATDFDPFGASGSVNGGNVMFKQVAFKQAVGGGWSYQVLAGGFTFPGANPGFFWDEASKKFVTHALRRWTAQSPNPAIGKFFFWFTQSSSDMVLNYMREFVDAAGTKRTATGTVPLPVLSNLSFILSQQIGSGGLAVSEDGLHIGDFLGSSTTTKTPPDGLNIFDSVTENKYYELFITLSETPTVELNLLRTLRDTVSVARVFKPDSSALLSASDTFHFEDQRFVGYFNGSKELYGVTSDINASGSGAIDSIAPCLVSGDPATAFANWQSSFVQTARFREGALVYSETCDNSAGTQRTGGTVFKPLTYRSDDAIYDTRVPNGTIQLNFRNVAMTPNMSDFVAESSPIGEIFFAKPDLSVIVHEPRPGGMKKIVLPSIIIRILGAIWL